MPCYDPRTETDDLKPIVDQYARMCCDFCTHLEKSGNGHLIVGDMKIWWEQHKIFDKSKPKDR